MHISTNQIPNQAPPNAMQSQFEAFSKSFDLACNELDIDQQVNQIEPTTEPLVFKNLIDKIASNDISSSESEEIQKIIIQKLRSYQNKKLIINILCYLETLDSKNHTLSQLNLKLNQLQRNI